MKLARVDVAAVAAYVAAGGMAGVFAFVALIDPKHAPIIAAAGVALISIAGIVRVVFNPTATNTVQVFDRNTGSTVTMKTVAPPSDVPASPPTYTAPPAQKAE